MPDLAPGQNPPTLGNTRYKKCQSVFDKAQALGIGLLYLLTYSPNLNLTNNGKSPGSAGETVEV